MTTAAKVASVRVLPEGFFKKFIRVKGELVGAQRTRHHLTAILAAHNAIDDGGMDIFFGHQKISRLGNGVAIFVAQIAHAGNREVIANQPLFDAALNHIHHPP